MASSLSDRLGAILATRQYLNSDGHELHDSVKRVEAAIKTGEGDSEDLLDRLEKQVEVEQEALERAFKLFDNSGRSALSRADVKSMNRYLGFPAEDEDVDQIMQLIDTDRSGTVTFPEFYAYVGRVGGTSRLFEERHRRIGERLGAAPEGEAAQAESLASGLQRAGIDREAQQYWRLVVPAPELQEAAGLQPCQQQAVACIRRLSRKNHERALPALQARVHALGFQDDDLWLTLAWIRELAPIIVHVDLDKMLQFLERDTHYRNQFETKTSGGLLKKDVREKWERDLFSGAYGRASGFDRPKYGVQNVMNDHRGVVKCAQYGDSYIILKGARLRCTFSPEDSANLKAERLAVLDFYAHVLNEYSDSELIETFKVANSGDDAVIGDSSSVGKMKYKEAQIHGEVAFGRHVERLVAHTRHRDAGMGDRLAGACQKHGFALSWMDEEQDRMRREPMHRLGGTDWQARLLQLQEDEDHVFVPPGFCRTGCGRCVAPGLTRAGKPFTTCCRGCIEGFGHDRLCGKIDASKVGPGLCKNGCGLKVAPGTDGKGRPLTTCCRGCALGMGHDASCQKMAQAPAAGMCRMGCGRKVAPGHAPSGRAFDTCCRDCARGTGHSEACIA